MSNVSNGLDGLRVFIVEDDLVIAMELEGLLSGLGCRVFNTAASIGQALPMLAGEPPDVAVLDVNLRGQLVTPVAEALRERDIPFVLVTGYGSERLREPALQGVRCLRKPVDAHLLRRALCEVLARDKGG